MGEHGSRAHDEDGLEVAPDLEAVLADDRLVEALGAGEPVDGDVSDDVVAMLVAWRDQIDAAPLPVHPNLAEAETALLAALARPRWRVPLRVLSPVAAAAAAVGIALTGIGYAAHQSAPGDPLWGVSQAIFTDHSRSVQAAANVTAELADAATAIDTGTPDRAQTALKRAEKELASVGAGEGHQALERQHSDLQARLNQAVAPTPSTTSAASDTPTTTPAPTVVTTSPTTTAAPSTTDTLATTPPTSTTGSPLTVEPSPPTDPTSTTSPTSTDTVMSSATVLPPVAPATQVAPVGVPG